jgi:hypothetical protein
MPLEREKSNSCTPIAFADGLVGVKTTFTPLNAALAEADLPLPWSAPPHPISGQRSFYREENPRIITKADLFDPETMKQITHWVNVFYERLTDEQIALSDSTDLFLQLGDPGEPESCGYYFIDHDKRTMFWIDSFDPENLGLSHVTSTSHLSGSYALCKWRR